MFLNTCVKRVDYMPPEALAREADITHNNDQAPAWHKCPENVVPDLIELFQERVIVINKA